MMKSFAADAASGLPNTGAAAYLCPAPACAVARREAMKRALRAALRTDANHPWAPAALLCDQGRVLAREISWETLALVGGLFILVDAMESIGTMRYTQQWLAWAQRTGTVAGELITGFGVGIANNLVNNLPLGLIAGSTLQSAHITGPIAHAVMIGVDLGPNLSITGSLATILWLIALRKEKLEVTFWHFLKIGAVAMPIALVAALGGSILMQFV